MRGLKNSKPIHLWMDHKDSEIKLTLINKIVDLLGKQCLILEFHGKDLFEGILIKNTLVMVLLFFRVFFFRGCEVECMRGLQFFNQTRNFIHWDAMLLFLVIIISIKMSFLMFNSLSFVIFWWKLLYFFPKIIEFFLNSIIFINRSPKISTKTRYTIK